MNNHLLGRGGSDMPITLNCGHSFNFIGEVDTPFY
jgi:hypothetical protein